MTWIVPLRWTLACAVFVAMTARAALPPLPADMPFDDAMTPSGMPPLPRAITTDVANPFKPDTSEDVAGSGIVDPSDSEFGDAEPKPRGETRTEARQEALEGPPSRSHLPRA